MNFPATDAKSIDEAVGWKLKQLRVRADKTQSDVADALGVSTQQYQKYEKAQSKCALEKLALAANYFDVPTQVFLPEGDIDAPGFSETAPPALEGSPALDDGRAVSTIIDLYTKLSSPSVRRKVIDLLKEIP